MRFLHESLSNSQEGLQAARVACADGCWFCCSRWVDAKGLEVLHMARGLRDRPDRLAALKGGRAPFGALSYESRKFMFTPCPLLENDRCSIYADRPLTCRSAVSRDAAVCERSFLRSGEPIPRPVVYNIVGRAYALALTVALFRAGLDHRAYEFTGALLRACEERDAEHRWLDGEDIFSGVNRAPNDLLNNPQTQAFLKELDEH
jgi:hypothetical protein